MIPFVEGQRWQTTDGSLSGVIIEVVGDGGSGILAILDRHGIVIDEYAGTEEGLYQSGVWRRVDP